MSKNKKLKNKGVVPAAMNGKRFDSLSEFGYALGFKPSEQPTPRSVKCKKCGAIMRHIPGTNVWLCDAMVEKEKNGTKQTVPCGNRMLASVSTRPQNHEYSSKPKFSGNPAQHQTATA